MPRLHYVYGNQLGDFPLLRETMFRDRTKQFIHRLGWRDLVEDENGWERDEFDYINPLYIIWELNDGTHGASMRILPTTGRSLTNSYFINLLGGHEIKSPFIWECTRFVVSERAGRNASFSLLLGAGELMEKFGLEKYISVFDRRMVRFYRKFGAAPEVIGRSGEGAEWLGVGVWGMEERLWQPTLNHLRISRKTSKEWLNSSFNHAPSECQEILSEVA